MLQLEAALAQREAELDGAVKALRAAGFEPVETYPFLSPNEEHDEADVVYNWSAPYRG